MEVEDADVDDYIVIAPFVNEDVLTTKGAEKRHALGVYLTTRRRQQA